MEVRRFNRRDRRDSAISDDYDNDDDIVYENFIIDNEIVINIQQQVSNHKFVPNYIQKYIIPICTSLLVTLLVKFYCNN